MRKVLNLGSLLIVALAVCMFGWLSLTEVGGGTGPADDTIAFPAFPRGQSKLVEFDVSSEAYRALSPREKKEQQRDWLLFAVLTSSNLAAVQLEQALHDVPPVRADTLASLGQAETGEARSRVLGTKRPVVVALIPKADSRRQADLLADVVDEQRKNTGDVPEELRVFEYELLADGGAASIVAREPRPGKTLFTSEAGYIEQPIRAIADLQGFLKASDDVVSARLDAGTLVVGGRKLQSRGMKGIGVEEIATVWKSSQKDPQHLGFSLDPEIDKGKLQENFARVRVRLEVAELPRTRSVQRTDDLLTRYRAAFFEQYRGRLPEDRLEIVFRGIIEDSRFQKARYDGDFQGTEVGMVLFYTDLLMKLWGQDQQKSTPRSIPEFPNQLLLDPPSIHEEEVKRLSGTRFWLGPKESALQKDAALRALYMGRVATRLFAVPHDILGGKDLKEAEPHVFNRVYIDWWNRHYAEVAQYEPQYERLNQIVKWSTIIGWLQAEKSSSALTMLASIEPPRNFWFKDWAESRRELTFRKWSTLGFKMRGYQDTTTEAIDIQRSEMFKAFGRSTWNVSGGVSLGSKSQLQKLAPLSREVTASTRRGGISAVHGENGGWKLVGPTGTSTETTSLSPAIARSVITPGEKVRLRGLAGEFKAGRFERTFIRDAQGVVLRGRVGEAPLGELHIARAGNGLKVGWQARDLDTAYALAKDVSTAAHPEAVLASHPDVAGVISRPNNEYLVQLRGSKQWVVLSKRSSSNEAISEGNLGRASAGPTDPIVDAGLVKATDIDSRLKSVAFVEVRGGDTPRDGISLVESARPPPGAQPVSMIVGGKPVEAFAQGNKMFLKWQALSLELRTNLPQLAVALGHRAPPSLPMEEAFAARSYPRIADALAKDPANFRKAMNNSVDSQLRRNAELWKQGRLQELRQELALWEGHLGELPEFRLQKALIHLEQGNADASARSLDGAGGWRRRTEGTFLDEIDARARDARFSPIQRENYQALVDYAGLSKRAGPEIRLGAEMHQGRLQLRYEVGDVKKVRYPVAEKGNLDRATIYMEDSPGLNQVDWSPGTAPSQLRDWIKTGRVEVYSIQDVDLTVFRPVVLVERTVAKRYRLVRSGLERGPSTGARANCSQQNPDGGTDGTQPCLTLMVRQKPTGVPPRPSADEWRSQQKTG